MWHTDAFVSTVPKSSELAVLVKQYAMSMSFVLGNLACIDIEELQLCHDRRIGCFGAIAIRVDHLINFESSPIFYFSGVTLTRGWGNIF